MKVPSTAQSGVATKTGMVIYKIIEEHYFQLSEGNARNYC